MKSENREQIQKKYFGVEEAAAFLGYTVKYIYKLCFQNKIPYYKPNKGKILFCISELDEFISGHKVFSAQERNAKAEEFINSPAA
jgi:excisionase family DNA binding protein